MAAIGTHAKRWSGVDISLNRSNYSSIPIAATKQIPGKLEKGKKKKKKKKRTEEEEEEEEIKQHQSDEMQLRVAVMFMP